MFAGTDPPREAYTVADLAAAEDRRTVAGEAVLQLGSDDVIVAARAWHNTVFRLQRIAAGQADAFQSQRIASGQPADLSWPEAVIAASKARGAFYEAAREDLGVARGQSPEAYEWQFAKLMVPAEQPTQS